MASGIEKVFPELRRPPIAEVVCGVVFNTVANLDALMLGVYWDLRKADFPKRQLHPALSDEFGFAIGPMPMRAFIVSADDQFVLQLQHDRFFMNWRATGKGYPRFSEKHGPDGLLSRMEKEFARFQAFVRERCQSEISPARVELSKIDMLERGVHWDTIDDLARLLPVTGVFQEIQRTDKRDVNLVFVERGPEGAVSMHITTLTDGETPKGIRIDGRFVADAVPTVRETFVRGNDVLNEAFFKLIPEAEKRFGGKAEE